ILQGTGSVRLAAAELDLDDAPHRVVAIDVDTADAVGAEGMRLTLWEKLTEGIGRRPAVAELHEVLYAVVPDRPGEGGWPALRAALAGASPRSGRPLVAAGPAVGVAELSGSRACAEETL